MITNTAGGKVALSGYTAQSDSQVLFDVVTDSQSEGVNEPILLAQAANNAATMTTATFTGNVEQSQVSIRLSDRFGNGSSALFLCFNQW